MTQCFSFKHPTTVIKLELIKAMFPRFQTIFV